MQEHTHLLAEHDVPVALCIIKNGRHIDWQDHLPEEVMYVPEEVFHLCAPAFLELIGDFSYYGTTVLSENLLFVLEDDLGKALDHGDLTLRAAAQGLLDFLQWGRSLSESHYMAFEGP